MDVRANAIYSEGRMSRRAFTKLTALGTAAALSGISNVGAYPVEYFDTLIEPAIAAPAEAERVVYSICEMCPFRCGIKVTCDGGVVKTIEGNPKEPHSKGKLCARGNSAEQVIYNPDRVKYPLIRTGERGAGGWKRASWGEALDYTAGKLKDIEAKYGPESIAMVQMCNLMTPLLSRFLKALGSPNFFSILGTCKISRVVADIATLGTHIGNAVDYKNAKYIMLFGRNSFETPANSSVQALSAAITKGAKLVYLDPRFTVTASKADEWIPIKPGTDLAFVLAMMNVIIREGLYDGEFLTKYTYGFDELKGFIGGYTPEWAEGVTGVPAEQIERIAVEFATTKPAVAHPNWHPKGYESETQISRGILILNALVGNINKPGGIFYLKGVKLGDIKPPAYPEITAKRVDGIPEKYPLVPASHGLWQLLPDAIINEDPYPVKGLIVYRSNPLHAMPNRNRVIEAFKKLDLLVAIDILPSDTAWYADVILPECTYLERYEPPMVIAGKSPKVALRQPCVEPMYESKPGFWILKELAEKLGIGSYFNFELDDYINAQLKPLGIDKDYFKDHEIWSSDISPELKGLEGMKIKTPTGKIEIYSKKLEANGFDPLPTFVLPKEAPGGMFRLLHGHIAVHTHANPATFDNAYLNEICSENELWINTDTAGVLGIMNGEYIWVENELSKGKIKAKVTEQIRPDTVFMLHGFGHLSPDLKLAYGKGLNDGDFIKAGADPIGGVCPMDETFVRIYREG
ncbi:MAG: molybdopterin-containing oxidoreductase family protein [Candidatus Methanospirareceae archaeon]